MEFVSLFLTAVFCTLGVISLCGLAVCMCSYLFRVLCGRGVGYAAVLVTSVVGTPIHELGHAAMCLLFGHRIERMRLWNPKSEDGRLGYVEHSFNKRSLYQCFGNLFIGIGPMLFGCGVVLALLYAAFPLTFSSFVGAAFSAADGTGDFLGMMFSCFGSVFEIYREFSGPDVWQIIALVLIFSVCLHISLSPEDLRGALRALPPYAILLLAVCGVTCFFGETATRAVSHALIRFAFLTVALFSVILAFSVLLLAFAVIVFLLRLLFGQVGHGRSSTHFDGRDGDSPDGM